MITFFLSKFHIDYIFFSLSFFSFLSMIFCLPYLRYFLLSFFPRRNFVSNTLCISFSLNVLFFSFLLLLDTSCSCIFLFSYLLVLDLTWSPLYFFSSLLFLFLLFLLSFFSLSTFSPLFFFSFYFFSSLLFLLSSFPPLL